MFDGCLVFSLFCSPAAPRSLTNAARMNTKTLYLAALVAFSSTALRAADALDEKGFQTHMKSVGKVAKGFKANLDSKNAAAVEKDATTAAAAYEAMTGFWKARKTDDAIKFSSDSAAAATATAAAAAAGDWDKVNASWKTVNQNCKACHDKHREKLDDGSYKIK